MTFSLEYEIDYHRLISAVVNDSRSVIPSLSGADGNQVYAYAQSLIAMVVPGVIVYRIVGNNGILCGIMGLNTVSGSVGVVFQQSRPAFVPYLVEINQFISIFIASNAWMGDILY